MLAITTAPWMLRNFGIFSATNARTPMVCSPTAFIMPAGVSMMRGLGLPAIGSRDRPLVTKAPIRSSETISSNSTPYPKVPLAAITGERNSTPAIVTRISGLLRSSPPFASLQCNSRRTWVAHPLWLHHKGWVIQRSNCRRIGWMLDLGFVRANLPLVEEKLRARGMDPAEVLRDFNAIDRERRDAITQAETLKAQRNAFSAEFGRLKREGKDVAAIGLQSTTLKERSDALEAAAAAADDQLREIMQAVPNLPQDSVPIGKSEHDNSLEKTWGTPPTFPFPALPH